MTRQISAIIGMQYGSEAKGALAGYLALKQEPDTVVCAFTPNAGHSFQYNGDRLVTSVIPIGAIAPSVHTVLIGPGAVFDLHSLYDELRQVREFRERRFSCSDDLRCIIHPNATVLHPHR